MKHSIESADDLRASNALLKLKLELEHGMELHNTSELPPDVENQWLQNIYDFEKQFQESGKTSVYNLVGRPAFTPLELLTMEELPMAILEMTDHLREHGICLDFCCEYDDTLIYRFITTEFFAHEMDMAMLECGTWYFTYEDFHPNHDYDLRRFSNRFISSVVSKASSEFETFVFADTISLHDTPYSRSGISCLISFFQDLHAAIQLEIFTIQNVHIDLENEKGVVRGDIVYIATNHQKQAERIEGPVMLHFEICSGYWEIVKIEVPGL